MYAKIIKPINYSVYCVELHNSKNEYLKTVYFNYRNDAILYCKKHKININQ